MSDQGRVSWGLALHRACALHLCALHLVVTRYDPVTQWNPIRFIRQTRTEVSRITWPGRREVALTTVMVFAMAMLAAAFFFMVDFGIRTSLEYVLGVF